MKAIEKLNESEMCFYKLTLFINKYFFRLILFGTSLIWLFLLTRGYQLKKNKKKNYYLFGTFIQLIN